MVSLKELNLLKQLNQKQKNTKIIPTNQIIKIGSKIGYTQQYLVYTLSKLKKEGYLENPVRGGWRLTEKAINLLKSIGENHD